MPTTVCKACKQSVHYVDGAVGALGCPNCGETIGRLDGSGQVGIERIRSARCGPIARRRRLKEALGLLGDPDEVFRPSFAYLFVGLVTVGVIILFGVLCLRQYLRPGSVTSLWPAERNLIFLIAACMLFLVAVVALEYERRLSLGRVLICHGGLIYVRHNGVHYCRWEEISRVQDLITIQDAGTKSALLNWLLPKVRRHSLHIYCPSGTNFTISHLAVGRSARLRRILRETLGDARWSESVFR
jgi:predicted RNA-binding Zn-ribbon protein involved in translation (DUF1610 family)